MAGRKWICLANTTTFSSSCADNTEFSSPMFAVLTPLCSTDSVVLVQGAELRARSRKPVFLICTLEAGQNTLTKQISLWLHLWEKFVRLRYCVSWSCLLCFSFPEEIFCVHKFLMLQDLTRSIDDPREYFRLTLRFTCTSTKAGLIFQRPFEISSIIEHWIAC